MLVGVWLFFHISLRRYITIRCIHFKGIISNERTHNKCGIYLFFIENDIIKFVEDGRNLYIHSSTCGNGKTAWSIRMLQSYINKIWYKSDLTCRVLFINVPRFILALKDSMNMSSDYIDHIKRHIFDADIVVFDEVGTKSLTTWEHEQILNLVNTRIDLNKTNIYTSNLTGMELREKVGDRLYSRIINLSTDVELFGKDKRGIQ